MLRKFLFIPLVLFIANLHAQVLPDSLNGLERLIKGTSLLEDEKYDSCLFHLNQVHDGDTLYKTALLLKMGILYDEERFDEMFEVCALADKQDLMGPYQHKIWAMGLQKAERTEEGLKHIDQAIQRYPVNGQLYAGKARILREDGRYEEALEVLKQLWNINPYYADLHKEMGLWAADQGLLTQAMLSVATYTFMEDNSNRQLNGLVTLQELADGTFEDLNKQSVVVPSEYPNIDKIVANKVVVNPKYKIPGKIRLTSSKQLHAILDQLPKNKGNGFWEESIVPLYRKVNPADKFEGMILAVSRGGTSSDLIKALEKGSYDSKEFLKWFGGELAEHNPKGTYEIQGESYELMRIIRDDLSINILVETDENDKPLGNGFFFSENGALTGRGQFDNETEKQGTWTYFYADGDTASVGFYEHGEHVGQYRTYNDNGYMTERGQYSDDMLSGKIETFDAYGNLDWIEYYSKGDHTNYAYGFYPNGDTNYVAFYKANRLDGVLKEYHPTGHLASTKTFVNGVKNGPYKDYNDKGNLVLEGVYVENEIDGPYASYHANGQVASKGNAKAGSMVGHWEYFYPDGTLSESYDLNERGKFTGDVVYYDRKGVKYTSKTYQKEDLKSIAHYDAQGQVIYEEKAKGSKLFTYHINLNRDTVSVGQYVKGENEGLWKYYRENGSLEAEKMYKDGKREGLEKYYWTNGQLKYELEYEDGLAQGPYKRYNDYGKLIEAGQLKEGDFAGHLYEYYNDGTIETKKYFVNGTEVGTTYNYGVTGELKNADKYDDQGNLLTSCEYDTLGNLIECTDYSKGNGVVVEKYPNGKIRSELSFVSGQLDGPCKWYYANGQVETEGAMLAGKRHGKWTWYRVNGLVNSTGDYHNGDKEGLWKKYYPNGNPSSEVEYLEGDIHGTAKYYYDTGELRWVYPYEYGKVQGRADRTAPDGQRMMSFQFENSKIIGFTYLGSDGKPVDLVPLKNETGKILTYYQNGQKSMEYEMEHNWIQGPLKMYYENGQLLYEANFVNDGAQGTVTSYYKSGQIRSEREYVDGQSHGPAIFYHPNGKLESIRNFQFSDYHGWVKFFDESGKETEATRFFSDVPWIFR